MKGTVIVYCNSVPEVKRTPEGSFIVDFGLVVLELTRLEMESFMLNMASVFKDVEPLRLEDVLGG